MYLLEIHISLLHATECVYVPEYVCVREREWEIEKQFEIIRTAISR